ncbi:MAG: hypothetical protein ABWY13_09830 [Mesorhizobium sp.]
MFISTFNKHLMKGGREGLGEGVETHVVTREDNRLDPEFFSQRHPHAFDGLSGGLSPDAHDNKWVSSA